MTKTEIEYEDAPSGFVTLYNYKEPFMPFKKDGEGYGYEGVLLFDGTTDKIQCHLCGQWLHALGHHLHREHNMKASAYKEMVGLRQTTALVSETLRSKMIANGLDIRLQNLRAGKKKTQEEKDKIRATLKKVSRQKQNETGTCPAQLIDRLQKRAQELGRTPTTDEISFIAAICRVYGNYTEACKVAGLQPRKVGQTMKKSKYTKDSTVVFVKDFWIKNGKFPSFKNFISEAVWRLYKENKKEVNKQVLFGEGKYQKSGIRIFYTKEELLQAISRFKKINGRFPSVSDCKRGLLPYASRYYYHFGNLKNAIKIIENYEEN